MIGTALTTLLVADYLAHKYATEALRGAAEARLSAVMDNRTQKVTSWAAGVEAEAVAQAENSFVTTAFRAFRKGWNRHLAGLPDGEARGALRAAFSGDVEGGEAERVYRAAHERYHDHFARLVERTGFDDVLLVNLDGDVIYTARKGLEFASNLREGPLSRSAVADVFEAALTHGAPTPVFSEHAPYIGAEYELASFLARPLKDRGGAVIGVAVFQTKLPGIGEILADRASLGETGQAYLVNAQGVLVVGDAAMGEPGTTEIDSRPVRRALDGAAGREDLAVDGQEVIAYHAPVSLLGGQWALIVQQSLSEIAAPELAMARHILRDGSILLILAIVVSILVARSVTRPLARLQEAMARIRGGDHGHEIPHTARGDEVGRMARALADFRDAMVLNDELARDGSFKGAAFEGASSAQTLIDLDMTIAYANQAFEDLLRKNIETMRARIPDLDPGRVVGRSIDLFQEDPERIRGVLSARDVLPYRLDLAIGELDFVLTFSIVRDQAHEAIGFVVEWKDVTMERMREAMLEAINTRQVMAEFDMSGHLVTANPAFCALMEQKFEALRGRALDNLLAPAEGLSGGDADTEDLPGQSRFVTAGTQRILEGGMTTVLDREGVPNRLLLIGQDITRDHEKLVAAEADKRQLIAAQSRVVDAVSRALAALAHGDLSERIEGAFDQGNEALRIDFNHALETLSKAMRTVLENADAISAEAGEITNAAEDLSRRTEHQAVTLEETAAALDMLTRNLTLAAGEAEQADGVVRRARDHAKASGDVVSRAVEAMGQISESSQEISRIIGVIDEIAFQTNLLALNAGVEAARAGDAGRGFAVVASEVRALAQRSADAAQEISSLISKSGGHVAQGVDLVGQAGEALRAIVGTIEDVSSHVSRIAVSATEQSGSIAEINAAVTNLDRVTQQNAAMFEETTAASHSLTKEAAKLRDAMAGFKVMRGAQVREGSFMGDEDHRSQPRLAAAVGQDFLGPVSDDTDGRDGDGRPPGPGAAPHRPHRGTHAAGAYDEPDAAEIWEEF
ncbi:MAG: methyl-accepting chemotaxis protein [Pseudomonadota bacterium]